MSDMREKLQKAEKQARDWKCLAGIAAAGWVFTAVIGHWGGCL